MLEFVIMFVCWLFLVNIVFPRIGLKPG